MQRCWQLTRGDRQNRAGSTGLPGPGAPDLQPVRRDLVDRSARIARSRQITVGGPLARWLAGTSFAPIQVLSRCPVFRVSFLHQGGPLRGPLVVRAQARRGAQPRTVLFGASKRAWRPASAPTRQPGLSATDEATTSSPHREPRRRRKLRSSVQHAMIGHGQRCPIPRADDVTLREPRDVLSWRSAPAETHTGACHTEAWIDGSLEWPYFVQARLSRMSTSFGAPPLRGFCGWLATGISLRRGRGVERFS